MGKEGGEGGREGKLRAAVGLEIVRTKSVGRELQRKVGGCG
jgi:hypothetical protein